LDSSIVQGTFSIAPFLSQTLISRFATFSSRVQLPVGERQQRAVWLADTFSCMGAAAVKGAPVFKALAAVQPWLWPLTPYWLRRIIIANLLKVSFV
jgi:hypothetical protein